MTDTSAWREFLIKTTYRDEQGIYQGDTRSVTGGERQSVCQEWVFAYPGIYRLCSPRHFLHLSPSGNCDFFGRMLI